MWWVKLPSLETVYENVGWSIHVKTSPEQDLKDDKAKGVAEGPHKRTGKVEEFQPKKEEEDERPEQQGRKLQPLLGSCFQGRAVSWASLRFAHVCARTLTHTHNLPQHPHIPQPCL